MKSGAFPRGIQPEVLGAQCESQAALSAVGSLYSRFSEAMSQGKVSRNTLRVVAVVEMKFELVKGTL